MLSYTEYYRQRLNQAKICQYDIDKHILIPNITGKKRKYEEAMGYPNDYEIVQDPQSITANKGSNWIDAYLENLSNNKK